MTIAAGALLALVVEKLFLFLVVGVVADLAILLVVGGVLRRELRAVRNLRDNDGFGLGMPRMERLVHADFPPVRFRLGFPMASAAGDGAGFLLLLPHVQMAAGAEGVVDVHHLPAGGILQPFKLGRQGIDPLHRLGEGPFDFRALGHVAGGTVLVQLLQRLGVGVVKENHFGLGEISKRLQRINRDDIRPALFRLLGRHRIQPTSSKEIHQPKKHRREDANPPVLDRSLDHNLHP